MSPVVHLNEVEDLCLALEMLEVSVVLDPQLFVIKARQLYLGDNLRAEIEKKHSHQYDSYFSVRQAQKGLIKT